MVPFFRNISTIAAFAALAAAVAPRAQALSTPRVDLNLIALEVPPPLDSPVFSLATVGPSGKTDMNIITYATPVGIRPTRRWVLSLYKTTQSYENFAASGNGVLQLLRRRHAPLVYPLGGQSGRDTDKAQVCAAAGFAWASRLAGGDAPALLPECAAYFRVRAVDGSSGLDAGDHWVAFVDLEEIFVSDAAALAAPENDGTAGAAVAAVVGADGSGPAAADATAARLNDEDANAAMSTGYLRSIGAVTAAGRAVVPADHKAQS